MYPTYVDCAGYTNHINSIPEIQFVWPAVAVGVEMVPAGQARKRKVHRESERGRERDREKDGERLSVCDRASHLQPGAKYCPLI